LSINPKITAETFYFPLLQQFLSDWNGMSMTLTLDTSMLWDTYCLIEVCLVWGGRSIPLGQTVLEHGSATVGFEDYCLVLETTLKLLPPDVQVTLLADRGFVRVASPQEIHGALIHWLQTHQWSWMIRAKSDLNITFSKGQTAAVGELLPPEGEAYLFRYVTILHDIECHLATAHLALAGEPWAVLSEVPPSLQTVRLSSRRSL